MVLPTVLALMTSYTMRIEGNGTVPGNHVIYCWKSHIIDYERRMTFPLTLKNLHKTCGTYCKFEGIKVGYSIIPRPLMCVWDWPIELIRKLNSNIMNWNEGNLYAGRRKRKRK